jgi:hypothetical protein
VGARLGLGALSVIVALVLVAALLAPAVFSYGLVVGGWQLRRWGQLALGVLVGAAWGYAAFRVVRSRRGGSPDDRRGS